MQQERRLSRKQLGGIFAGGVIAATTTSVLAASPMMTAIPVIGDDAFEILEHDHRRIKTYLERLINDSATRRDTLMNLSTLFTVHNATEENYVYPAVANIAHLPNDAAELFHQQDEAKSVVWSLHHIGRTQGYDSQAFTEMATTLLHAALKHVHLEESRDFPRLRAALGPVHLAELTHEVRQFRSRFS